ncbi:MAG: hypothetical protein HQ488_02915 [Parcubacteria group bacterium]|nr:hypothetical protein [Parcubacteria group bacterium]
MSRKHKSALTGAFVFEVSTSTLGSGLACCGQYLSGWMEQAHVTMDIVSHSG